MRTWKGDPSKPLVSICCITYNHEKYIEDALEGFLIQKTDFPFEIIIHDDASTDHTDDIIREYESMYPNLIKPIYQKENQLSKGKNPFLDFNLPQAKGKFIAFCEGDDYWTEPCKLKRQVDFLEANPEYSFCHTEHDNLDMVKGKMIRNRWKTLKLRNDSEENLAPLLLSDQYMVATCTALVRTDTLKTISAEHAEDFDSRYLMGDIQIWFHLARRGKVKYFQISMSTYRRVPNSTTATDDDKKRYRFIQNAYWQKRSFAERYKYTEIIQAIDRIYLNSLLKLAVLTRDRRGMMEYASLLTKLDLWNYETKWMKFTHQQSGFLVLNFYYNCKKLLKKMHRYSTFLV
jgi:glycosyltransferase involved in cell wall biosynthesis